VIDAVVTKPITAATSTATVEGRCLMVITCSDAISRQPGACTVGRRTRRRLRVLTEPEHSGYLTVRRGK